MKPTAKSVQGMQQAIRSAHRVLVGQPEGKSPRKRPVCRKVDNIKADFREIRHKSGFESFGSGQRSTIGSCEHGNKLLGLITCCTFIQQLSNCWFIKNNIVLWSWLTIME
jgi:hypothetical protein